MEPCWAGGSGETCRIFPGSLGMLRSELLTQRCFNWVAQKVPCERDTALVLGGGRSVFQGPFLALLPAARWFCPQQHWWVCVILTNPRSSGNYTAFFVHNRKDPRRFRVKWFLTLEAKLDINSLPVSFSGCMVWGHEQWQVHSVLEGSWTFGPQHISQLFITAANSCSFALDVYFKCVLQPLVQLSWDCLWGGSWAMLQPTGFWALEQPGWESWRRVKFAALRSSMHGHLLEEYQHFMCPVLHLSLVIHFTMHYLT